jgi:hypothetical protein
MSLLSESLLPSFSLQITHDGERSLILSVCNTCGQRRECSRWDGSLLRWEQGHKCESAAPDDLT